MVSFFAMNDSDPRPMPPVVARAYRDPLNLTDLLESEVFPPRERLAVRDELLERLIRKHGNVEVEIGKGTRTLPIRKRVAQFRKSVWGSIEVIFAAEELGGREAVMLELATVMQPHWLRWWDKMGWDSYDSLREFTKISASVLGSRQLTWLAAQYARSVIELTSGSARQASLAAISAAEALAIVPSEENRKRASRAADAADDTSDAGDLTYAAYNATLAAAQAAYSAFFANSAKAANANANATSDAAYSAVSAAAAAAAATAGVGRGQFVGAANNRLSELTKRLITPTMITHASRGLR